MPTQCHLSRSLLCERTGFARVQSPLKRARLKEKETGGGMQFMQQNCRLTLRDGLEELYRHAPEVAVVSQRKGKIFVDHDLTHVLFGCDTSLQGEILLKPWILFGTTINRDELKAYAMDPDVQMLNEEGVQLMGGRVKAYTLSLTYYLPLFFWIWLRRVRRMSAKWPHSDVTEDMMNTPLDELRRAYGIRLYQ